MAVSISSAQGTFQHRQSFNLVLSNPVRPLSTSTTDEPMSQLTTSRTELPTGRNTSTGTTTVSPRSILLTPRVLPPGSDILPKQIKPAKRVEIAMEALNLSHIKDSGHLMSDEYIHGHSQAHSSSAETSSRRQAIGSERSSKMDTSRSSMSTSRQSFDVYDYPAITSRYIYCVLYGTRYCL